MARNKTIANREQIAKYVKAGALLAGALGHTVSPEYQGAIVEIAIGLYTLVTLIQGLFFKASEK